MTNSGLTLITFAVPEEARPLQRRVTAFSDVRVILTGIGAARANEAFDLLIAPSAPTRVLSAGFAGGLDPGLPLGAVLFDARGAPHLAAGLAEAGGREGRFTCSPRVVVTAADKAALRERTGADAVEMESGVLSERCRAAGIPCAIVRVISDPAGEDLPLDFNRLLDTDGSVQHGGLARELILHPGRIPALLRFRSQIRQAAERLARVLAHVLQGSPG